MEFSHPSESHRHNLLPRDGVVHYFGKVFSERQARAYFESLLRTIAWEHDTLVMFGKRIVTKRKVAWYGGKPFAYTYSGSTKKALPWTDELLELKARAESLTAETYNTCLLNLYHRGDEGMGWHSDDEKMLKRDAAIASMSFGAERKFAFKHRAGGETVSLMLENGSLLLMKGPTQRHWRHRLPPANRITEPRINLTFRTISVNARPA